MLPLQLPALLGALRDLALALRQLVLHRLEGLGALGGKPAVTLVGYRVVDFGGK